MDFCEALKHLNAAKVVRRDSWGTTACIAYTKANGEIVTSTRDGYPQFSGCPDGMVIATGSFLAVFEDPEDTCDGPWVATQADLEATDWEVVTSED